jgi:hypothetical protein
MPLYAFIRQEGYPVEEAKDLTQEFFARWLERRDFDAAARKRPAAFLPARLAEAFSSERAGTRNRDVASSHFRLTKFLPNTGLIWSRWET